MKNAVSIGKLFIAFVVVIIVICIVIYSITSDDNSASSLNTTGTQSTEFLYIVSEYKGKVAVYKYDSKTPLEIYDTYTDSLPESDRIYLKQGIEVKSEEELEDLIEDLTS